MGIPESTPLRFVTTFKHEDERQPSISLTQLLCSSRACFRCRTWGGIYSCFYDGELKLQEEEVQAVLLMSAGEIFARQNEFTGARRAGCALACVVTVQPGDSIAALRILLDALPQSSGAL